MVDISLWKVWTAHKSVLCAECNKKISPGEKLFAFGELGFPGVCSCDCKARMHEKLNAL